VKLVSPANTTQLKISQAQIRVFSAASGKNPEIGGSFDITFTVAQFADNTFLPIYWPVFCLKRGVGGAITYKNLQNASFSATSTTKPVPAAYCT
jgi:hypothetical protein